MSRLIVDSGVSLRIRFGVPAEEAVKALTEAVLKEFPGYQVSITPDVDVSD